MQIFERQKLFMRHTARVVSAALCMMLLFGAGGAAHTAAAKNLLVNGDFSNGSTGWEIVTSDRCTPAVVEAKAGTYQHALRLTIKPKPGDNPWDVTLAQPIAHALKQGAPLTLTFWLRSPDAAKVTAIVELAKDPYTRSLDKLVTATAGWQQITIHGTALQAFAPGEAHCTFHLDHAPGGTLEIAGIALTDSGQPAAPPKQTASVSLIVNGDFSARFPGKWLPSGTKSLTTETVAASIGGFKKSLKLTIKPPPDSSPWTVQMKQYSVLPIAADDTVYVRVWMRSPSRNNVGIVFEEIDAPNRKAIERSFRLTPEWYEYRLQGKAFRDFAAGESQINFFLGYGAGVVEIAGVRVESYGQNPAQKLVETIIAPGEVPTDDTWRKPALARIEKMRKGDLVVHVVDPDGNAVPGATVRIEQKRHLFRFGTAGPASRLLDGDPDSVRYRQEVKRLFNTFVFENDMKWETISPPTFDRLDKALVWLEANHLAVRGHNLVWGSRKYLPASVKELHGAELLAAIHTHIDDYTKRYQGKVYVWDVVNEAGAETEVWQDVGWENFANAFKWARAQDTKAQLCYNEYNITNREPVGTAYYERVKARIKQLQDAGAPVTTLGDQAHIGLPMTPIGEVLDIWNDYEKFGLPVEITEFDFSCLDDKVHGDYCRDFLIAAFSDPKIESFIMWGFWEGSHWLGDKGGAMLRRDWSKRPAALAYEDLVLKQWWTRARLSTDIGGGCATRAFYGTHTLTVEKDGRTATQEIELLPGGSGVVTIKLLQ